MSKSTKAALTPACIITKLRTCPQKKPCADDPKKLLQKELPSYVNIHKLRYAAAALQRENHINVLGTWGVAGGNVSNGLLLTSVFKL